MKWCLTTCALIVLLAVGAQTDNAWTIHAEAPISTMQPAILEEHFHTPDAKLLPPAASEGTVQWTWWSHSDATSSDGPMTMRCIEQPAQPHLLKWERPRGRTPRAMVTTNDRSSDMCRSLLKTRCVSCCLNDVTRANLSTKRCSMWRSQKMLRLTIISVKPTIWFENCALK